MAYDKEVFNSAKSRMNARRAQAISENAELKTKIYLKIPRLEKIERELALTSIEVAKDIIATGGNTKEKIEKLKANNLALQEERKTILIKNGYPPDILKINYFCSKCCDTGYCGDSMCDCFKNLLREEACKKANAGSPLPLFTFKNFDLKFYPDTVDKDTNINIRKYMTKLFNHCKAYAENFKRADTSILMLGKTGLGKTHLSLSIANEVIEQGYGVIYDTAQNVFMKIEDENFGRSEKKYNKSVLECDLLILDELPDYASPFWVNTLYNIINTRMLRSLPMIVSTNLSEKELVTRYGERIFSRLIGQFELLRFFGTDIRQQKLRKKSMSGMNKDNPYVVDF